MAAAAAVVVEEVVLGTLARRWYLHLGSVNRLIVLVGSFVFGFVVLYADGRVGAEGVPVLDIAICQCDPPMYLHPVRCHTISGYPRPCSVWFVLYSLLKLGRLQWFQ